MTTEDAEELLLTNVTMTSRAIQLDAISVTAQRPPPSQGNTGENSMVLSQELLARLPLPDMDPNTLALLAAGLLGTGAESLSGRLGLSVGGMSDLLNQITLDNVQNQRWPCAPNVTGVTEKALSRGSDRGSTL